jgi:hypothetical protein
VTNREFRRLLEKGYPDLMASLEGIDRFLVRWWKTPYLPWFTDHGPDHSHRVVEALFEMLPPDLAPNADEPDGFTGGRLSVLEMYIAVAAALLHDLGMQSLGKEKLGEHTADQYQEIRREHPRASGRAILANAVDIGLPDEPDLRTAISMVAEAHGTETFRELAETSELFGRPRNARVFRPSLLCSLVLMADELDMHSDRATFPAASSASLAAVSEAHQLKHHYVTAWSLAHEPDGTVEIHIRTAFPASVGTAMRELIGEWLSAKLKDQIGLVNNYLRSGTSGRMTFRHRVRVNAVTEARPERRALSGDSEKVIRAEVAAMRLIDFGSNRRNLKGLPNEHVRVVAVLARGVNDVDGREEFLRWFASTRATTFAVVPSERLLANEGGYPSDVLGEWCEQLTGTDVPTTNEETRRSVLLERLVSVDTVRRTDVLLTVAAVEAISDPTALRWFCETAVSELVDAGYVVAMSVDPADKAVGYLTSTLGPRVQWERLTEPNQEEVMRRYRRYWDNDEVFFGIRELGTDYRSFKVPASKWELELEGIA